MLCSSRDLDHYINKKTSLFNHEIAYLIPNSPFAQYQYFFSSISYPFITSFHLCQFAQCQYQLFPSLTFLNLHNTNTFTFLSFSKYFSLFSNISSLILQCLFIFIYLYLSYLPFLGYWLSYLSLSPFFEGDNFFSSCFHIFFFTVNNLQYDRPHNFISL